MSYAGYPFAFLLLLSATNETATSSFLSRDFARFALVILPILTGIIVCVLIVYGERAPKKVYSPVLKSGPVHTTTKQEPRHTHRNMVVSIILASIIAIMIIGGATLAVLDYYTFTATGAHLHFDMPIVTSTGNSFLDLGTLMLVALTVGVLLVVGIMVLAISIRPKPDDLIGWTRPEGLTPESRSETGPTNTNFAQEPQDHVPKPVVCRYCGRKIPHGRYCPECHLTSGYVASNR